MERTTIEGAFAALLFATVTFQSGLGVVRAPRADVETLTAGALEGPIFPAQHMDIGLTRFRVEKVVEMRHHRHSCVAPLVIVRLRTGSEFLSSRLRFWAATIRYKLSGAQHLKPSGLPLNSMECERYDHSRDTC